MVLLYDKIKLGDYEIINYSSFIELFFRFGLNLGVVLILARWLYYSGSRRKDYLFTYILISSVIFLLCYLLESVKLQMGFALGLFAIFGIIRYRTDQIPIKEMTYLFMIIGVSVINSLFSRKTGVAEVLFTNLMIIIITYGGTRTYLDQVRDLTLDHHENIAITGLTESHNFSITIGDPYQGEIDCFITSLPNLMEFSIASNITLTNENPSSPVLTSHQSNNTKTMTNKPSSQTSPTSSIFDANQNYLSPGLSILLVILTIPLLIFFRKKKR